MENLVASLKDSRKCPCEGSERMSQYQKDFKRMNSLGLAKYALPNQALVIGGWREPATRRVFVRIVELVMDILVLVGMLPLSMRYKSSSFKMLSGISM
jgi:hypothetical protein